MLTRSKAIFKLALAFSGQGITPSWGTYITTRPTVALRDRTLAFTCSTYDVDISIVVLSGVNSCFSGAFKNYVTISTSDGAYSEYVTSDSVSGNSATFNAVENIGCLSQNVSYINFQLSYKKYWFSSSIDTCIIVKDSMWTTASSSNTLSDDSSSVTYSKSIIYPPSPTPTQAPTVLLSSIPTLEPTSIPSILPTPLPSRAPTFTCTSGYYYDSQEVSCMKCQVGHFSNYSSGYFNFSSCILCPAGRYAGSTGSGSCTECASGKLSQPSRVSCADCSAGEYASNDVDCVYCPRGQYAPQPLTGSCLACSAGFKTNKKTGATSCSTCSPGTFCARANTCTLNCSICPYGTYSLSGQSACTSCIPGW
jgi:hypothetical protein